MEASRGQHVRKAALSAITAVIVGVVLDHSAWLTLHTLFGAV